jgi:hypothetical protein
MNRTFPDTVILTILKNDLNSSKFLAVIIFGGNKRKRSLDILRITQ